MAYAPTAELVAVSWVGTATGLTTGMVATKLPGPDRNDNLSWAASGFVQLGPVVGGSSHPEYPLRESVLQATCWAANPKSGKPPWGMANRLAELIVTSCYTPSLVQRTLVLPSEYGGAKVLAAQATSEPRRVRGDVASYAAYTFDLQLSWVAL